MRILSFTDLHLGVNKDENIHLFYLDLSLRCIDKIIDICKKEDIDRVVFCGDMFENMVYLDQLVLNYSKEIYNKLNSLNIPFYKILGNHSIYDKTNKKYNYCGFFKDFYKNIKFIENLYTEGNFLYVPWLQNQNEINEYNKFSNDYEYHFGHLELNNIQINSKYKMTKGIDIENKKSIMVLGHYHTRIIQDNIYYIGTPYPMDADGYNTNEFGVFIIDTNTKEKKFINLNLLFYYEFNLSDILNSDLNTYKEKINGNFVRICQDIKIDDKELNSIKILFKSFSPKSIQFENIYIEEELFNNSDVENKILVDVNRKTLLSSPLKLVEEMIDFIGVNDSLQKDRLIKKINTLKIK